jgi:hypothetical protein
VRYSILLMLLLGLNAHAWDNDKQDRRYKSRFGNEYEYDLSKPSDQIRYETDVRAQMRDQLDVDPRRELERDLGQYGGGKVKRRY